MSPKTSDLKVDDGVRFAFPGMVLQAKLYSKFDMTTRKEIHVHLNFKLNFHKFNNTLNRLTLMTSH